MMREEHVSKSFGQARERDRSVAKSASSRAEKVPLRFNSKAPVIGKILLLAIAVQLGVHPFSEILIAQSRSQDLALAHKIGQVDFRVKRIVLNVSQQGHLVATMIAVTTGKEKATFIPEGGLYLCR